MPNKRDQNLQIVNASGFPFQLRIAEEIRCTPGRLGWEVIAEEHFWSDRNSGQSGFIDIVAGFGIVRLVIECKRGAEATWIFLVRSSASPDGVSRVRALCTDRVEGESDIRLWADLMVSPNSPEAGYCVVRGQGDKEPMLERVGATVLQSAEALADEELSLGKPPSISRLRVYVPVIITAATLQVCRFDPIKVDINAGRLPAEAANFEAVPVVRFRKALSGSSDASQARDLDAARKENERTVLVVQAKAVTNVLESWDIKPSWGEQWPHSVAREGIRRIKRQG
ncbi:MAG TPA: hypothetical protein VI699_01365 [Candidatus Acidoferrales bacterium]|nr:hypothetical protein [Candidatus Acidoferrales bacterium]